MAAPLTPICLYYTGTLDPIADGAAELQKKGHGGLGMGGILQHIHIRITYIGVKPFNPTR